MTQLLRCALMLAGWMSCQAALALTPPPPPLCDASWRTKLPDELLALATRAPAEGFDRDSHCALQRLGQFEIDQGLPLLLRLAGDPALTDDQRAQALAAIPWRGQALQPALPLLRELARTAPERGALQLAALDRLIAAEADLEQVAARLALPERPEQAQQVIPLLGALGERRPELALPPLLAALEHHPDQNYRVVESLLRLGPAARAALPTAYAQLEAIAQGRLHAYLSAPVRLIRQVERPDSERLLGLLLQALDGPQFMHAATELQMASRSLPAAVAPLLRRLQDSSAAEPWDWKRERLLWALARHGSNEPRAYALLIAEARGPQPQLARRVLATMKGPAAQAPALRSLAREFPHEAELWQALGKLQGRPERATLDLLLAEGVERRNRHARQALAGLRPLPARYAPALRKALKAEPYDPDLLDALDSATGVRGPFRPRIPAPQF